MVASYVSSWEASCLSGVYIGHEVPPNHCIINLIMVSSIWAVLCPSSGYFVFSKCIRQHKIVGRKQTPQALDLSCLSLGCSSVHKCLSSS